MIDAERVDFVGVPVQDLKRADEFDGGTLGLKRSPHSSARWVEYETGNVTLALISPEAMGPDFQPQPHSMPIALRVADVEEAKRKLEGAGVEFPNGTIDSGVCHMAGFSDPDGNALMLHCRYAPHTESTP